MGSPWPVLVLREVTVSFKSSRRWPKLHTSETQGLSRHDLTFG